MLNYNHLFYFYVVVKEGGVSAASRKLRVSQPALSSQVKRLEQAFEARLFARVGRTLQLTERGRFVYGYARQMYELGEELQSEMKQLTKPRTGRIQLGVADDVERPLAVRLVRHLLRGGTTERRRMVTLCTGSHENLLTQLREQSLDAVLSDQPMYSAGLETLGTTEMPVSLVVPRAVKPRGLEAFEASSEKIARQLRASGVGLIMPSSRLRFRGEIDRFLNASRLTLPVVFESDNLASVVRAVLEGVGAAFLPLPYVEDSIQREQVVPLGPPQGLWRHPLHLFALPEAATTNMAASLRAAFVSLDRAS